MAGSLEAQEGLQSVDKTDFQVMWAAGRPTSPMKEIYGALASTPPAERFICRFSYLGWEMRSILMRLSPQHIKEETVITY